MSTQSSSIADATSNVAEQVARVLRSAIDALPDERAARTQRVLARIRNLESRGFIKRQKFCTATTEQFERRFACIQRDR